MSWMDDFDEHKHDGIKTPTKYPLIFGLLLCLGFGFMFGLTFGMMIYT